MGVQRLLGFGIMIGTGVLMSSGMWAGVAQAEDELRVRGRAVFGELPKDAASADRPVTKERADLGRTLYFDPRLSKNQHISCNSCHQLDRAGVDGEATSPGHRGQRGGRNSPTVYNAALHLAQFWDGREPDVEAQAKGPVLNPIEMAMPSEAAVLEVLRSIPGYAPMFAAAFPQDSDPITYDNMGTAIGAFERLLLTPAPFDRYLAGDDAAISAEARRGLESFLARGCVSCHMGPAIGGSMYRKLGFVRPYATEDVGREAVTGKATDRHVFKVPSLRNVTETGPWFHDGSIADLDEAVRLMGHHQLGIQLDAAERADLVAFLGSLSGSAPADLIAKPDLPPSGPGTPKADPN
jgi:cytochrome c peroxidase